MQKNSNQDNFQIDTSEFDKTLKEIEKTLQNLGSRKEIKQNLEVEEVVEIDDRPVEELQEHQIDNSMVPMDELHNFSTNTEEKKKSSFGFYTYLSLGIIFIFATYEILNISKNLIISNYPFLTPYIEYFYEVIEILTYLVINTINFIKSLF